MPVYDVELSDGRTVTLEGDHQPTEADVMSAIGGVSEAPKPTSPAVPKEGAIPLTPTQLSRYVAGGGPMAGMASLPPAPDIPRVEGGDSTLGQIGAAGLNTASSVYNAAKSPMGVTLAAVAPASPLIGAGAGLLFGIPAAYRGLKKVYEYGGGVRNLQEGLEGAGEAELGSLMTLGGLGGVRGALERPTPETATPTPPPRSTGPLLLGRGPLLMPEEHGAPPLRSGDVLSQAQATIDEAARMSEDARLAKMQAQKRASQASPTIIGGEPPAEPQVIPASSQSMINLARRGVMKFQFDQLQRDFSAAQEAGDGPEMGKLQKQMIDLQRQLHPLELEREQLSSQFEGEGEWPPTSEQLGTFQSKGRPGVTSDVTYRGEPSAEALPSANKPSSTKIEVTKSQKSPGIISGTSAESWADNLLKGGGTHAGPDVLAAYAVKGAAVIELGVRNFAEWSKEMVKQFGEDVKPHLRDLYNQSIALWQHSLDQPKEKTVSSEASESVKKNDSTKVVGPGASPTTTTSPPQVKQASNVLTKARDTITSLWKTKDVRDVMTYTRDAGDSAAKLFGESQGNDISGDLSRATGRNNDSVDQDALSFAVEAGGDKRNLAIMRAKIETSDAAGTKWANKAIAAIDRAIQDWDKIDRVAREYSLKTDTQVTDENANGINTPKRANYVMHAQEAPDEWGFLSGGQGGGGGAPFKHIRTHPTFADSIAAGVDPKTINAVDLLKSRLAKGQTLINNRKWVDSLRTTTDPKTGSPIVTDPEVIQRGSGLPADHRAPNGYHNEFAGGRAVAVLDGYGGIFDALTSPSKLAQYAGTRALLKSAVAGKSVALMVDTFHLARIAFWESVIKPLSFTDPKLPIPSYKKGVLLLDYTPQEIVKMGKSGDLPPGTVNEVLAGKKVVDGLVQRGYNVGRISDALHQEWISAVPALGKVNQFIFKSFQRGAMAEVGVLEFGRYQRMHPSWAEDQVYREVAKDLNTRFGNIGRQGIIKSKTNQDLARLIALAPQWNESLIRSELGAITGTVKGVASSAKEGKLSFGVLPRAIGAMMVGQFAANQIINYATRGHPTWGNPEEGFGAKVSAWIPDVVGKGPGFFLHPFGLAAEVSHLIEMKMEKNPNFRDALLSFAGSRLSTLSRPVWTYVTGHSTIGNRPIRPEDINKETAYSAVPLPIGGSAAAQVAKQLASGENKEAFPGQYQKQLMSSVGMKTDQAPSFEQRISSLAHKFNEKSGFKPTGEFYPADWADITGALRRGAVSEARKDYEDLRKKKTDSQIIKHFSSFANHPFTRSRSMENQFFDSLNEEQKQAYQKAVEQRAAVSDAFFKMLGAQ